MDWKFRFLLLYHCRNDDGLGCIRQTMYKNNRNDDNNEKEAAYLPYRSRCKRLRHCLLLPMLRPPILPPLPRRKQTINTNGCKLFVSLVPIRVLKRVLVHSSWVPRHSPWWCAPIAFRGQRWIRGETKWKKS